VSALLTLRTGRGGRTSGIRLLALGSLVLAGCASTSRSTPTSATADLKNPSGQTVGRALLTPTAAGVQLVVEVQGLPPGPKALHIHETGACTAPGFTSAGGHFNPDGKQHGSDNPRGAHAGDLPNLVIGSDGTGRLVVNTDRISLATDGRATSLLDADGSALVVHAAPDDLKTDPTGNSGGRIACGVVTPVREAAGADTRPAPRTGY
jgi:Cu-Zn family superoxide dismutase